MKAVGYYTPHALDTAPGQGLQDLTGLPAPVPRPHDLRVRMRAVSVNPVDTKVRASAAPEPGQAKVLGWDAVGTVEALGAEVRGFAVGDRVFYAGAIDRPGTNAELHAVDARIAAHAPAAWSDAEAAAVPLTAITAWELLFDRLGVARDPQSAQGPVPTAPDAPVLLVVGGAGGVGSMLIQIARQLTGLRVVATASRPETRQWCLDLGAHAVIDHRAPFAPQLAALGIAAVDAVASLTHTADYLPQYVECLRPQGRIAVIDDMPTLDVMPLKRKSLSLHWELMFTRSLFGTPDLAEQGRLLAEVAALAQAGRLRSTLTETLGPLSAATLHEAHARIESGRTMGKLVLTAMQD
ncbi:zinc-binding alcohol dehydrogenase family protein [Acidovorax sp. GBBC 3334]|uniref:zinc-binding alcohol dehydrogenase family protein n=1 Tax=Acidovorax sp. GBBC 3334 TaxID=2940496 RepID=UPI0023025395|nr:zinc-binding alcohol dehydrogenase family protein [Acidovorax sp. GBBC 3334]MDA8455973.1 zinc-binding alcohol dehydrogenase family protein [Acidovorax sp. GBBC 3334]